MPELIASSASFGCFKPCSPTPRISTSFKFFSFISTPSCLKIFIVAFVSPDIRIFLILEIPLAKEQRQTDVLATMQMLQVVEPVSQIDPNIIDHLDCDCLI